MIPILRILFICPLASLISAIVLWGVLRSAADGITVDDGDLRKD